MLIWTFKWIIVSLLLIFLLHHLYCFFKDTLTIPKVKDLVNKPNETYKEIYSLINNNNNNNSNNSNNNSNNNNNNSNNSNNNNNDNNNDNNNNNNDMDKELINFLNDLKKYPDNNTQNNLQTNRY